MMSRQIIINYREQYVNNETLKEIFCDKDIERDFFVTKILKEI
jgi:hypothetical protein